MIDPVEGSVTDKDILLHNGLIAEIGKGLSPAGAEVLDATGKFVVPGLVDMHVHLREPGYEAKETILNRYPCRH